MTKVTALKPHRYANKSRAVGVEYDIPGASDLRLYKALGWVQASGNQVATPAPASAPVVEPAPVKRGPGRPRKIEAFGQYNRRDLVAREPSVDAAPATDAGTSADE